MPHEEDFASRNDRRLYVCADSHRLRKDAARTRARARRHVDRDAEERDAGGCSDADSDPHTDSDAHAHAATVAKRCKAGRLGHPERR